MAMRCPKCGTPMDPFKMETWRLNGIVREVADALASQVGENPAAPEELKRATKHLQDAAENFTNTLYQDID